MTLNFEAFTVVASGITQTFEGVGLRVLYLVERVCCQLVGEDALHVPMDPPEFMLAPLSMTNVEYALWSPGVAYVNRLREELDYEDFNRTCLMPSLTIEVCALSSHLFPFLFSSFAFLYMVTFN